MEGDKLNFGLDCLKGVSYFLGYQLFQLGYMFVMHVVDLLKLPKCIFYFDFPLFILLL